VSNPVPVWVLIVDDAAFMRELIKKNLRSQLPGLRFVEASDGKMAQARLQQDTFDLVLCDWEMPRMSGEQLLEWMRGNPATENVPFVMITSRGDRENVMRAVELKADNYIVKPFTADKLLTVVTRVLCRALNLSFDALRKRIGASGAPTMGRIGDLPIAATINDDPTAAPPPPPPSAPPLEERVVRINSKVLAQLRFSGHTIRCLLKEVSLQRLSAVIRRDDTVPKILDLAVFDMETSDGEVSRINGFVHSLQARERSLESEFINVVLEFVDGDDETKRQHLIRYMDEVSAIG